MKNLTKSIILASTLLGACSDRIVEAKPSTQPIKSIEQIVNEKPQEQKISQEFINAVIYAESGGNPKAERYESHIDDTSYGLMQVLTGTARGLSKRNPDLPSLDLNSDGITTKAEVKTSLIRPKTNVLYGTRLLEEEFERYGSLELTLSAYNAGSSAPRNALTQYQLNQIYGGNLDMDGVIGPLSRTLIEKFQRAHNLDPDGKPGPKTREKLSQVYTSLFSEETLFPGIIPQNGRTPHHVKKVMGKYKQNLANSTNNSSNHR